MARLELNSRLRLNDNFKMSCKNIAKLDFTRLNNNNPDWYKLDIGTVYFEVHNLFFGLKDFKLKFKINSGAI